MLFLSVVLSVVALGAVVYEFVVDGRRARAVREHAAVAAKALLRERERLVLSTADMLALRKRNEWLARDLAHVRASVEGLARAIDSGMDDLPAVSRSLRKILRGAVSQ